MSVSQEDSQNRSVLRHVKGKEETSVGQRGIPFVLDRYLKVHTEI